MRRHAIGLTIFLLSAARLDAQPPVRPVSFELAAQIGVVTGAPEYEFGRVTALGILPGGGVAVTDWQAREVRIFDARGRFVARAGRSGQGPGEFESPSRVIVRKDDFIVYDGRLQRYSRFAFDGGHLGDMTGFTGLRHGFRVEDAQGSFSNLTAEQLRRDPNAVPPEIMERLTLVRASPARADTLLAVRGGAVFGLWQNGFGPVGMTFGRGLQWAADGDSIVAVIDAPRGAIVFHRLLPQGPAVIRRVSLGLPPRPGGRADRAIVEQWLRQNRPALNTAGLQLFMPAAKAVVGATWFDDAGALWMLRVEDALDRSRSPEYIVVPVRGAPFTFRGPAGVALTAARGSWVAGIRQDEDGVQQVRVYRVRWD
jgi:hypothetical protein